jgi:nucleotide-binding universal stress UspA family protein
LKALDKASEIAKMSSGKLTLITVYSVNPILINESSARGGIGPPVWAGAEVSRMIEGAQRFGYSILQDAEQRVRATGVQVEKELVEGHTVVEIARAANDGNFDLIVIGARGASHISEMFLGSVTEGVLHHAHCPVLVIK